MHLPVAVLSLLVLGVALLFPLFDFWPFIARVVTAPRHTLVIGAGVAGISSAAGNCLATMSHVLSSTAR